MSFLPLDTLIVLQASLITPKQRQQTTYTQHLTHEEFTTPPRWRFVVFAYWKIAKISQIV